MFIRHDLCQTFLCQCYYCWLSFFLKSIPLSGVPRLNTPPLVSATPISHNQEKDIAAPKPIRTTPNLVSRLEDLAQPWTRSPTKSKMEPVLPTWHFALSDRSHGGSVGMPPLCGQLDNLSISFPQVLMEEFQCTSCVDFLM